MKTVGNPCCFISLLEKRLERNAEMTSSCGQVLFLLSVAGIKSFVAPPVSWMICLHLCAAGNVGVINAEKGYPRCSVMPILSCSYKIKNMVSCNKSLSCTNLRSGTTGMHTWPFLPPLLYLQCFDSVLSALCENVPHILSIFFSWPDLILSPDFQIYCSVPIPQILNKYCVLLLS